LACTIFFCTTVSAAEKTKTQVVTVSPLISNKITPYPMIFMADDPLAIEINKWQERKRSNKEASKDKNIKKYRDREKVIAQSEKERPEKFQVQVIELEIPDNELQVTNKTKSFVFNDATSRVNSSARNSENQNIRRRNIELLRQSMARK